MLNIIHTSTKVVNLKKSLFMNECQGVSHFMLKNLRVYNLKFILVHITLNNKII